MLIMLADYDPGTLSAFFVVLLFGIISTSCLILSGAMSLMEKPKAARGVLTTAAIIFVIGAVLLFLVLSLGKDFHLP